MHAAFGELAVVAGCQPFLVFGDFNVEPTKILCLPKGVSAGLFVDLAAAWACALGVALAATCKRSFVRWLLVSYGVCERVLVSESSHQLC